MTCLPDQLLSKIFIVKVESKRGRGLRNDWGEQFVSFKNSLYRLDCPSCLFMGHMYNFWGLYMLHVVDFWPVMSEVHYQSS